MVSHECLRDGRILKRVPIVLKEEEYVSFIILERYVGYKCPHCGELTFWEEKIPDSDVEVEAFCKEVTSRKEQVKLKVEAVPVG